jgi:hypothetical protein
MLIFQYPLNLLIPYIFMRSNTELLATDNRDLLTIITKRFLHQCSFKHLITDSIILQKNDNNKTKPYLAKYHLILSPKIIADKQTINK